MLQKTKMVRKVIERLYLDTCTITCKEEYEKPNGSTGFKDVIKCEDEPCKLSYSSTSSAVQGEVAATVGQTIKLFIRPDIEIHSGSKILVKHDGVIGEYKRSGIPAVYDSHQEIILDFKGYA